MPFSGFGKFVNTRLNVDGRFSASPVGQVIRWIVFCWEWWSRYWLHFQAIAAPIGSLLVTLWLSQSDGVGLWWNTPSELEVAAKFASGGVLFYTASFAALEMGVMFMVLAWKVKEYFDKKQMDRGVALGAEAQRRSQSTGREFEEVLKELKAENWQPPKS